MTNTPAQLDQLDLAALETKWPSEWERKGVYHWNQDEPRENGFVIDTPPPTVSGYLHMGHIASYSQADITARYQRMSGKNVFYPIGFDDNGLPTERLVEKVKGVKAADMPREDFIKLCQEVVQSSEEDFRKLFRHVALSVDWRQEYQTVSPTSMALSQMSFLDLFAKGILYRSEEPSLWDPVDRTALAQAEVEEKEQQGVMYHIPFGIEGSTETITIATTRPELLGACVAVMYHPESPLASQLAGKKAITPLFGALVPFVADEKVDPEKGTGIVMCCTFGDPTDMDWWRIHKLALRDVVNKNGTLGNFEHMGSSEWPVVDAAKAQSIAAQIQGQHVRKAKPIMVQLLKDAGLLLKEEPVTQQIPCAERSGAPLEIIVTKQWKIRLLDKKEELIEKGRQIKWHPEFMRQRFESWTENLKWDWLVSRQRYFGVPVPFWYSKRKGEEGKILVPTLDQLPVNPLTTPPTGYTMDEVEPDMDVMDTWATSSITPQMNARAIAKGYALDEARAAKLFPADMRPQSHEIIRTWAFYTIAKALLHSNTVPFHNAAISGWILAADHTKMSKSKGNGVPPDVLLKDHGADVVRYWAGNYRLGNDTAFSVDVLKQGRRLATKLWNASKLVAPQIGDQDSTLTALPATAPLMDRWIMARLADTLRIATKNFSEYCFAGALEATEAFFWKDYCDNYLEACKGRLYGEVGTQAEQDSARHTLAMVHRAILSLLAPFMPYLTEELFSKLYPEAFAAQGSVHARSSWPKAEAIGVDEAAQTEGAIILELITGVRRLKAANKASVKAAIPALEIAAPDTVTPSALVSGLADFQHMTSTRSLTWVPLSAADDTWQPSDNETLKVRGTVEMTAAAAKAAS